MIYRRVLLTAYVMHLLAPENGGEDVTIGP